MRILLLNDYATVTAGAERVTQLLRDGLRARGHEVRILASDAQLIAGSSIADVTCFGTTSRWQNFTSAVNPSAARTLREELRTFRPDLVQAQMFLWQLSPAILPVLRGVPSVYYAMTHKSICPSGLKWLPDGSLCQVRAGAVCLQNRCVTPLGFPALMLQRARWRKHRSAFRAIVTVSADLRARLEADDNVVREVIWPGTLITPARPPLADPPTAAFVGRLTSEKGVDVLFRAFALVRQRLPAARLEILGTGPAEAALGRLCGELDLGDAVSMRGHVATADLDSALASAWVLAVPSVWPEPFGLVATEAMMRGTAVVASRLGGLAESVVDQVTGLHVPAGDHRALGEALLRVLADRESAERLGAAGRVRAMAHFSVDGMIDRFEALYAALNHAH
ncbi:MAG: glycosyltransferase family 4 protein [Gemmatimonadales bacterium]|nr:glycosyltransferase family 4 protein [Gemmatimonadales bacterium]